MWEWLCTGTGFPERYSVYLEIFTNCLDAVLCSVLWDDPAWAGRLVQMTYCHPIQPYPICDSVKRYNHLILISKFDNSAFNPQLLQRAVFLNIYKELLLWLLKFMDFGNSLEEMHLCPKVAEKILVFNILVMKVNMRWSGSVRVWNLQLRMLRDLLTCESFNCSYRGLEFWVMLGRAPTMQVHLWKPGDLVNKKDRL